MHFFIDTIKRYLAASLLATSLVYLIFSLLVESPPNWLGGSDQLDGQLPLFSRMMMAISLAIVASFGLFAYFKQKMLQKREREKETALRAKSFELAMVEAKLSALTLQMNPHFLFNALNTLTTYIRTQPSLAEELTIKIAELLRMILLASEKQVHSLQKEMDICHVYETIQKIRYPQLSCQWQIAQGLKSAKIQIPVMVMQPLLENAINHADHKNMSYTVLISQRVDEVAIKISNPTPQNKAPSQGLQLALENCRQRLQLYYQGHASLLTCEQDGNFCVTLLLPLVIALP